MEGFVSLFFLVGLTYPYPHGLDVGVGVEFIGLGAFRRRIFFFFEWTDRLLLSGDHHDLCKHLATFFPDLPSSLIQHDRGMYVQRPHCQCQRFCFLSI